MTPFDLEAIEARLEGTTPGPWEAPEYRPSPGAAPSYNFVRAADGNICGLHDGGQTRESIDANAIFIAHARTDIPALIAEIRRLRG